MLVTGLVDEFGYHTAGDVFAVTVGGILRRRIRQFKEEVDDVLLAVQEDAGIGGSEVQECGPFSQYVVDQPLEQPQCVGVDTVRIVVLGRIENVVCKVDELVMAEGGERVHGSSFH